MENLTKRSRSERGKINMTEAFEVKSWTKALGVDRELRKAVDNQANRMCQCPMYRSFKPFQPLEFLGLGGEQSRFNRHFD
jgi:Protein of unknown function (DUF3606)